MLICPLNSKFSCIIRKNFILYYYFGLTGTHQYRFWLSQMRFLEDVQSLRITWAPPHWRHCLHMCSCLWTCKEFSRHLCDSVTFPKCHISRWSCQKNPGGLDRIFFVGVCDTISHNTLGLWKEKNVVRQHSFCTSCVISMFKGSTSVNC